MLVDKLSPLSLGIFKTAWITFEIALWIIFRIIFWDHSFWFSSTTDSVEPNDNLLRRIAARTLHQFWFIHLTCIAHLNVYHMVIINIRSYQAIPALSPVRCRSAGNRTGWMQRPECAKRSHYSNRLHNVHLHSELNRQFLSFLFLILDDCCVMLEERTLCSKESKTSYCCLLLPERCRRHVCPQIPPDR